MAWCDGRAVALPTPSAFFHHPGTIMKSNREQPKPTAEGGTIEADGGGGEMIAVARAQRELIDTLARLVLAEVEQAPEVHDMATLREATKDQSGERRKRRRRDGTA
jgi:hypothetical protein